MELSILSQKTLDALFEEYLMKKPLFLKKNALTTKYTPETIPH